jgi:hypothetical protein
MHSSTLSTTAAVDRGGWLNGKHQCSVYADDVHILGGSVRTLRPLYLRGENPGNVGILD